MLKWLVLHLVVTAIAFAVAAWLIPSFEIKGGVLAVLWVAAIFGVVNAVIGPILRLLSLPLTIITLGLFALVVNGIVLSIVAGLSEHLETGGFGWVILAALVISVVSTLLGAVTRRALVDHPR